MFGCRTRGAIFAALVVASGISASCGEAMGRHARHLHAPTGPPHVSAPSSEPARIIQVRPGVFISSYDCITDEGQGRWRPCDTN
jgi:hypothetical protein